MIKFLIIIMSFTFSLSSWANGNHGGIGDRPIRTSYNIEDSDDYMLLIMNADEILTLSNVSNGFVSNEFGNIYEIRDYNESSGEAFFERINERY